jgi:hypothetical protein
MSFHKIVHHLREIISSDRSKYLVDNGVKRQNAGTAQYLHKCPARHTIPKKLHKEAPQEVFKLGCNCD